MLRSIVENEKELKRTIPTFLLSPKKLNIYVGKDHIAIEYLGTYNRSIMPEQGINCEIFDYTEADNFLEDIVGIKYDNGPMIIPIEDSIDDLYVATLEATSILAENNWNFLAQEMIFALNVSGLALGSRFTRLRNCFFYEKNGDGLKVRNIKWMDIFPLKRKDINEDTEEVEISFPNLVMLANADVHYTLPEKFDFQYDKLMILNRFIELYNSEGISETTITKFLAEPENDFILKMAFFGNNLHSEIESEWVGNPDRPAIRPDFHITGTNRFSDIVEFKLPTTKNDTITVGRQNRKTFTWVYCTD